MRIGVTGHMNLTPATRLLVRQAIGPLLKRHVGTLIGVSCLAPGADTIFARLVLDVGGRLEVVLPAADYASALPHSERQALEVLCRQAEVVHTMPSAHAGVDAYEHANSVLLDLSDQLVAVWDGALAVDGGGTGSVVTQAIRRRLPVTVIWPPGAARLP